MIVMTGGGRVNLGYGPGVPLPGFEEKVEESLSPNRTSTLRGSRRPCDVAVLRLVREPLATTEQLNATDPAAAPAASLCVSGRRWPRRRLRPPTRWYP